MYLHCSIDQHPKKPESIAIIGINGTPCSNCWRRLANKWDPGLLGKALAGLDLVSRVSAAGIRNEAASPEPITLATSSNTWHCLTSDFASIALLGNVLDRELQGPTAPRCLVPTRCITMNATFDLRKDQRWSLPRTVAMSDVFQSAFSLAWTVDCRRQTRSL